MQIRDLLAPCSRQAARASFEAEPKAKHAQAEQGTQRQREPLGEKMIDPTMFDQEDFQRYLDQPAASWMDFGLRCAQGLQMAGVQVASSQVDAIVARVVVRIREQTRGTLSHDRAAAFAQGLRAGLLPKRQTHDEESLRRPWNGKDGSGCPRGE